MVSQLTTEVCKIKGMASQLSSIIDVNYLICLSSCRFPPCFANTENTLVEIFFFFFSLDFLLSLFSLVLPTHLFKQLCVS